MNENFVWTILLPFVAVWAWMFFYRMPQRKPCPDCAQPLSLIQSPFTKTKRMWWEGGYLCSHCGCEVDMDGQKVPAGTAPQARSIVRGTGMLAIGVIPALILLYISFHRITSAEPAPLKFIQAEEKFGS